VTETKHDDVGAMSFEKALAELEQIVAKLESGQAPLAEARIEKITLSRDGKPIGTEPLDA
jgi:exodeoxyribonuclease VII small subunit